MGKCDDGREGNALICRLVASLLHILIMALFDLVLWFSMNAFSDDSRTVETCTVYRVRY